MTGTPRSRLFEPLLMISTVTAVLVLLSMVDTRFTVGYFESKKVDLFSEVISKGKLLQAPLPELALNDSIIGKAKSDILLKKKDKSNVVQFGTDTLSGLTQFLVSLDKTKKKKGKTRIAYFGDSMIEGDLISQDLRSLFQKMFGGSGVGYMPVTSIVAGFRQSIRHTFSKNWTEYNMLGSAPADHPIGITGHVFIPAQTGGTDTTVAAGASWVKFTAVNKTCLDRFSKVKLYYGKSDAQNCVSCGNGIRKLDGTSTVNEVVLTNYPVQNINVSFITRDPLNVYGFSIESDTGVLVDNLSFRGNSGMPLTKMSYGVLNGLNQYLDYDLIILQYGVNVVNHKVKDYSFYEKGMNATVQHLRNCFPKSSILIVSAGDKGYRKDGEMGTDPAVPLVVEAQRKVAEANKCAFWNLYEAMGGEKSMAKWVEGDTAYANKDYTHFNFRGASRIGTMLYNKLIGEYGDFKKKS